MMKGYNHQLFVQRKVFQKMVKKNIHENFRKDFFEYTTIGGLRHMFGRKPLSKLYKLLWFCMWLMTICYASYLCSQSIIKYLQYYVKTTIHYETVDQMEFPAITICSENMFRKSAVGGSLFAMLALADFQSKSPEGIAELVIENNRTCFKTNKSEIAKQFERENLDLFVHLGLAKVMEMAGMGSDVTVKKCWWENKEINCKNLFVNHITDYGWCYTFNPSKRYLPVNVTKESDQLSILNYVNRAVTKGGPGGLQLLLNTSQEEYCGAGRKYSSNPGFILKIHSPNVQPRMNSEKALYLSPGFQYNAVIKPTIMKRNTENLGHCLNEMNLMLYAGVGTYFKEACIWDGYMIMIWNQCKCYHLAFEGGQRKLSEALNIPLQNLTKCSGIKLNCVRNVDDFVLNSSPEKLFSNCKEPCFEVKYNHQTTHNSFPSNRFLNEFSQEFSVKKESLKKNYVLANFHFESLTVEIIEESQKYTVLDLFRYFGGILSLFLGVSVICLAEISYFFTYHIHYSMKLINGKAMKSKKVNSLITVKQYKAKDGKYLKSMNVTMF